MNNQNIIAYVNAVAPASIEAVHAYEKETKQKFRTLIIRDSRRKELKDMGDVDIYITCDFSKPNKIAEALMPYQKDLLAITCRGDMNIPAFAKVIPHVPYLRTPTTESLEWATDKLRMRRRFWLYDKKITPKYAQVKGNTKAERKRIVDKIGFPLIVKPANLAESMFVSICYHEEEFEKTLGTVFRKVRKAYKDNNRNVEPTIIAEEYMEGDMYSVDAYVNSRGTIFFCPLVKVVTGRNIGHDDFYNYMHFTPTAFKRATIERAEKIAETAIHALGLRNTTTHVELMKIDDEWKVIEIGPRMGGFRHTLYELSCGINHAMNDILIRIPKKPVIPKKCQGAAATLKWFPEKEGIITELKGIKKIRELSSFREIVVNKKVGDRARFAKNGGKSVFNVTLYNKDRSKLLADIRRMEKSVHIKINGG